MLLVMLVGCTKKEPEQQSAQPQTTAAKPVVQPPVELADYYLGIIRKGSAWTAEETVAVAELQRQHLARINHLADSGVLALAGPIEGGPGAEDLRGLFFYTVASMEEARALADSDPSVRAGRLLVDIFQWRGPADLTYSETDSMTDYQLVFYFKGPFYYAEETPPSFWGMVQTQTEKMGGIGDSCRIIMAGEFPDTNNDYNLVGMMVYQAPSLGQVNRVMAMASAIRGSRLSPRLMMWYGPVGLRCK